MLRYNANRVFLLDLCDSAAEKLGGGPPVALREGGDTGVPIVYRLNADSTIAEMRSVPGLVRRSDGLVRLAPNLEWHDVSFGGIVLAALLFEGKSKASRAISTGVFLASSVALYPFKFLDRLLARDHALEHGLDPLEQILVARVAEHDLAAKLGADLLAGDARLARNRADEALWLDAREAAGRLLLQIALFIGVTQLRFYDIEARSARRGELATDTAALQRSPVQAFALPLLTTIACALPRATAACV